MTTYPDFYDRDRITLDEMKAKHGPKMHPEFYRRFFAWIESMDGLLGVGGGWRKTPSPVSAASQAGHSFHQDQRWASGFVGYAAVDLVVGLRFGKHRAPTWEESETAPQYGLHTFIRHEPWHIQMIEQRGWQTWVDGGRLDSPPMTLPGTDPTPSPGDTDMAHIAKVDADDTAMLIVDATSARWLQSETELAAAEKLCQNTREDPIILLPIDTRGRVFIGRLPHYRKGAAAGPVRCVAGLWAQTV